MAGDLELLQIAAAQAEWHGTSDTLVVGWAPPELLGALRNCTPADVALWAPWALRGERSRIPGLPPPEVRAPVLPHGVALTSTPDQLRPALLWLHSGDPPPVALSARAVLVGPLRAVQDVLDHWSSTGCFPIAQSADLVAVKLA